MATYSIFRYSYAIGWNPFSISLRKEWRIKVLLPKIVRQQANTSSPIEVTLLPLAGRLWCGTLTRGDADRSARANRFWAFSPRVRIGKTMPLPPENIIANNAITSSWKNCGMHRHPRPAGAACNSPTQSEATRRVNQSTDVSPCRGKSVNCGMIFVWKVK